MQTKTTSDYAKGRADAAKGTYNPPQHTVFDTALLDSRKSFERTSERQHAYKEGHADKKREIKSPRS